jgi:hypothetical protein
VRQAGDRTLALETRALKSWPASVGVAVLPTLGAIAVGLTAQYGQTEFYVAGFLLVVALVGYVFGLRNRPELVIGGFLIWLTVERMAVASLAPGLDPETVRLMLGFKELFFPLLGIGLLHAVASVWRQAPPQVRIVDGLAVAFGILILVAFAVSSAPLMDRLIYARRLALLPLVYGVVRLLPWRLGTLRAVTQMVIVAAVAVAVFGFFERFVAESLIWREWIPAAYYYHLSNLGGLSAQGSDFPLLGLPVAFWDFTAGVPQRRLVSTFLEATTLASFLAFGTIAALATIRPRAWSIVVAGVIGFAGFLTLGKVGWLILAFGVGYVLVVSVIPRLRDPAWLASLAAALIGALAIVSLALEADGSATGALAHFDGLRQGIVSAFQAPMGRGLGIGGNFGSGLLGAESMFGVILVQVGILGLAMWAAWMVALVFALATMSKLVREEPLLGPSLAAAVIAFFGTAALTESAGGYLGNWVYALVPAAFLTVASQAAVRVPPEHR